MQTTKLIRVLIAKPGLDGHDQGAKVLTFGLRNEGMEVIYTGLRQTPESIARIAIQEDVNVIGLSSLSGIHNYAFPRVVELLREQGRYDILIIGGGHVPPADIPALKEKGVAEIFGPGTTIKTVADYIRKNVKIASGGNKEQ